MYISEYMCNNQQTTVHLLMGAKLILIDLRKSTNHKKQIKKHDFANNIANYIFFFK